MEAPSLLLTGGAKGSPLLLAGAAAAAARAAAGGGGGASPVPGGGGRLKRPPPPPLAAAACCRAKKPPPPEAAAASPAVAVAAALFTTATFIVSPSFRDRSLPAAPYSAETAERTESGSEGAAAAAAAAEAEAPDDDGALCCFALISSISRALRTCLSWSPKATLKSNASGRSAKPRPTKACLPVAASARRRTKLREESETGSTTWARLPGGMGATAKRSPLFCLCWLARKWREEERQRGAKKKGKERKRRPWISIPPSPIPPSTLFFRYPILCLPSLSLSLCLILPVRVLEPDFDMVSLGQQSQPPSEAAGVDSPFRTEDPAIGAAHRRDREDFHAVAAHVERLLGGGVVDHVGRGGEEERSLETAGEREKEKEDGKCSINVVFFQPKGEKTIPSPSL